MYRNVRQVCNIIPPKYANRMRIPGAFTILLLTCPHIFNLTFSEQDTERGRERKERGEKGGGRREGPENKRGETMRQ